MRKEVHQKDGAVWEVLWPETPDESLLTPVEAVLLRATLERYLSADAAVERQIATVCVESREFSNYGFFVNLIVPAATPAARDGVLTRADGNASIGFRESDRNPITTLTFAEEGRLVLLEGVPSDGENWTAADCAKLLLGPPANVWIRGPTGRDWSTAPSPEATGDTPIL